jgi:hypothetical protein
MIDDRTAAYIRATHPAFEDLRQVAAQLAGLLVLREAGARTAEADRRAVEAVFRRAADCVLSASATERARKHHRHLCRSIDALDRALALAQSSAGDPLEALREAYQQLQSASRTLPGFEMIHFAQGCCAIPRSA